MTFRKILPSIVNVDQTCDNHPMESPSDSNQESLDENSAEFLLVQDRPVLALSMLALSVAWFVYGWILATKAEAGGAYLKGSNDLRSMRVVLDIGALDALHLIEGQWWRLFSNAFVHFGLIHLLSNMFMLATLGAVAERLWGWRRFLIIYIGSGLIGSVVVISLRPITNGTISLVAGASGAIWGAFLSVIVWFFKNRHRMLKEDSKRWYRKLSTVLFLNLLISFAPGVSLEAHLGGGFAGLLMAIWLDRSIGRGRALTAAGLIGMFAISGAGLWLSAEKNTYWKALREAANQFQNRQHHVEMKVESPEERLRAITEINDLAIRLGPDRLGHLINRLKFNDLPKGENTPKTLAETEEIAKDVQAIQTALKPRQTEFKNEYLDYFNRLQDAIEAIQSWQRMPPRSPIDDILERQQEVVAAFDRLTLVEK